MTYAEKVLLTIFVSMGVGVTVTEQSIHDHARYFDILYSDIQKTLTAMVNKQHIARYMIDGNFAYVLKSSGQTEWMQVIKPLFTGINVVQRD